MTRSALLASCILAAATALSARGQSLLDQQLGPAPATPAADKPADTPKPAPAATPPPKADSPAPSTAAPGPRVGGTDIISPDAVKKVDDQDLIHKLTQTGDAAQQDGVKEQLAEMLSRMSQSEKRLTDKDPGPVTQETQRRIVADLDTLIELARQQQQSSSSQSNSKDQQKGQERSYSQGQNPGQNQQGGSTAATESTLPRGASATPDGNPDIRSRGAAEFGDLPARDRDLVAHGANEEYLSSYRDMIDRYYQALAELGKARNR
jgi:hypothetical protein